MQKPKLAFVDHSFHQKSRSGDFLREIFREHFDITDYWDESWKGGMSVPPEKINKHDYVFYFQSLNPIQELRKIRIPIVWAPMYDGIKFRYAYWKTLSHLPIKILSFSKAINEWLERFSIPMLSAQYYIAPQKSEETNEERIFFWNRGDVSFKEIKRIINPKQISEFIYFENLDHKNKQPSISDEDKNLYKIRFMDADFLPHDEYIELVSQSTIFVAPRKKEGVGMSFIEALSKEKVVIGYDDATFNEYVTDRKDGYIFNEDTGVLDLSEVDKIRVEARKRYLNGYQKWLIDRNKITPFMLESYAPSKSRLSFMLWWTIDIVSAFLRKTRYYLLTKYSIK